MFERCHRLLHLARPGLGGEVAVAGESVAVSHVKQIAQHPCEPQRARLGSEAPEHRAPPCAQDLVALGRRLPRQGGVGRDGLLFGLIVGVATCAIRRWPISLVSHRGCLLSVAVSARFPLSVGECQKLTSSGRSSPVERPLLCSASVRGERSARDRAGPPCSVGPRQRANAANIGAACGRRQRRNATQRASRPSITSLSVGRAKPYRPARYQVAGRFTVRPLRPSSS
jgi:hypothetical protein